MLLTCNWASLTSPRMESSSSLWRPGSGTEELWSWQSVFWTTGANWVHTHVRAYAEDTSSFSDNNGTLVPFVPVWTRTHLWCSGFSLSLCRASPGPRAWDADGSSPGKHEDECESDSFFSVYNVTVNQYDVTSIRNTEGRLQVEQNIWDGPWAVYVMYVMHSFEH